ncbi:P-loop NTPase fold protein [Acinetobacter sp. TY1]|uniref:P-loop NTPase fold protein n=1 Tax=Acinetobacter sp. TY1 TaxID=3387626 RepID=UPI003AF740F7
MDIDTKKERLKDLLEKNMREEKVGIAIAITGSWGVGKTYFWNKIREGYKFKNKYIYVSLFGLESLGDLKTHIYSNIENNHSLIEIPRWIRGLPSILKDTRVSQFGVNASAKVFDNLMFHQVKDAIICFDDFERMSNKLDIKDVMGLANQLKLEKNCQIILILDEDKTEDENKKKYAEYKEKLIDETIKITSVKPLILENTKGMDKDLVDLIVKFADGLEIHNFRFFQKIIKQYKQFLEQLPEKVAYSTKEIILVRILQGYLIEDYGQSLNVGWNDFTLQTALDRKHKPTGVDQKKINTFKVFEKVSYKFSFFDDQWTLEFRKWFEQRDQVDLEVLKKLAKSDLNSEKNNLLKDSLQDLMNKWRNLEVDEEYCEELLTVSSKLIGIESLGLLEFSAILLKKFGKPKSSKLLKRAIISSLKNDLENNALEVYEKHLRFPVQKETIFHRYIKVWRVNNSLKGMPLLLDVLKAELKEGIQLRYAEEAIKNAEESEWENFIFKDALIDPEFCKLTRAGLIDEILKNPNLRSTRGSSLKTKIRNILELRMSKFSSLEMKENYKFVIENFEKEGLL